MSKQAKLNITLTKEGQGLTIDYEYLPEIKSQEELNALDDDYKTLYQIMQLMTTGIDLAMEHTYGNPDIRKYHKE